MKNNNLANWVTMQQSIAKAVAGNSGLARLAEISQAITGHKKMMDNLPIAALAVRGSMMPELAGIASLRKQFQNPLLNDDFYNSMKAISENSFRIQASWKKILDDHPLIDMGKRVQEQQQAMQAMFRPSLFSNISVAVLERLNSQADEAATMVEGVEEKEYVSAEDFAEFKNFVVTSFAELNRAIDKAGKSPMVVIGFWLGVIGLLFNIYSAFIQPAAGSDSNNSRPTSQEQVEELKKLIETSVIDSVQEIGDSRVIKRNCTIRLKPKIQTLHIYNLVEGDVVNIIAINHKWAYITIVDKKDNLPVCGWVLKKYLH